MSKGSMQHVSFKYWSINQYGYISFFEDPRDTVALILFQFYDSEQGCARNTEKGKAI